MYIYKNSYDGRHNVDLNDHVAYTNVGRSGYNNLSVIIPKAGKYSLLIMQSKRFRSSPFVLSLVSDHNLNPHESTIEADWPTHKEFFAAWEQTPLLPDFKLKYDQGASMTFWNNP